MKKLFFTALVAVVAVGGAFAQTYYTIGSEVPNISCSPGLATCDIKYGEQVCSDVPASQGQANLFFLSTLSWDGLN